MRYVFIVLGMLLCSVASAAVQVSIGIGLPGVRIGINLPLFPELVRVPGYPVYYAPRLRSNFFFYDGMYWVYQRDSWYASSWYNGPWWLVAPDDVPLFVLRIPVRYYRNPPAYFRGWRSDAPPRWGEHWGNVWERHRSGWDRWNRSSTPAPAPLPVYQQQYSGDRYPRVEQQQELRNQNYRYLPRDPIVRQHYQEPTVQSAPAPSPSQRGQQGAPHERSSSQQDIQRSSPPPQPLRAAPVAPPQITPSAPIAQPPQQRGKAEQRGNGERRGEPVAPQQRSAQPKEVPSPQVVSPTPDAPQPARRAKHEPAPGAKQAEPRSPVAAPKLPPQQLQPAPKAGPRGQEPNPAAGKPNDKKKDSDEQKREKENRKQER